MLKSLKFLKFRQVFGKSTVTCAFIVIRLPIDTVMSPRQSDEVIPDFGKYFQITLNMAIAFMMLYLVFVGSHCFLQHCSRHHSVVVETPPCSGVMFSTSNAKYSVPQIQKLANRKMCIFYISKLKHGVLKMKRKIMLCCIPYPSKKRMSNV